MVSGILNGVTKSIFSRPRPYTNESVFDIKHTSGYSLPSGHSNSVATQSTMIAVEYFKNKKEHKGRVILLSILALICVIVGFSRIYLGQHYLTDVLVGLVMGVGITLSIEWFLSLVSKKCTKKPCFPTNFTENRVFVMKLIHLTNTEFLDNIIHILIASTGQVNQNRSSFHLLRKAHCKCNCMGTFNRRNNAFHS